MVQARGIIGNMIKIINKKYLSHILFPIRLFVSQASSDSKHSEIWNAFLLWCSENPAQFLECSLMLSSYDYLFFKNKSKS